MCPYTNLCVHILLTNLCAHILLIGLCVHIIILLSGCSDVISRDPPAMLDIMKPLSHTLPVQHCHDELVVSYIMLVERAH